MHTVPPAEHLGITKTYAKIRNRYFWQKMSAKQCEICAQANTSHRAKVPFKPLPVPTGPLERIHIDILSIAVSSHGAKYILVIICAFSKYFIARCLKRKTSRCVAKVFFHYYILNFWIASFGLFNSNTR